jgi:hypothetical protein
MKAFFYKLRFSFPVQLFVLHFRKYQVLLIFWILLLSTINSGFMQGYGADALFLVPEYLGFTNALAGFIVGVSLSIFFMSWNITTFILHSKRFKFLAASSKPFLKYCINNSVLPLIFLVVYIIRIFVFDINKELLTIGEVLLLTGGILLGTIFHLIFSFAYFFGADKTIVKKTLAIKPIFNEVDEAKVPDKSNEFGLKVDNYLNTNLKVSKVRRISHYHDEFVNTVFQRHHFAGVIGILLAFFFLSGIGFLLDNKIFQLPAASSIILLFAVLIAAIGALNYFFQSWVVLFLIAVVVGLNALYINEIIDPRNKAYGLNYSNGIDRPEYSKEGLQKICHPDSIAADKATMIHILNNWKKKQKTDKPKIVFINVSGGGLRSAAFVMNTMQKLDVATQGNFLSNVFLITGASGGMLSATYIRELYLQKQKNSSINLSDEKYIHNITQDLLNPIFSSMINRDIFSPAQKFTVGPYRYVKDRGYAFEEKLNANSDGLLGKQLKDYIEDERAAKIPMIIYNSVITSDGRKLIMGAQPLRFLMKPSSSINDTNALIDAVDFGSYFHKLDPMNVRVLTALRMNATFPYVLPNVWLPTQPKIDLMDAGLRDNYGTETAYRFIEHFKTWIEENTSGVMIIQIRDRMNDNWQNPMTTNSIADIILKPATMLQHNWYKFQDYAQADQLSYLQHSFKIPMQQLAFLYQPQKKEKEATLNFHLTALEKKDVIESFNSPINQKTLKRFLGEMKF